MSTHPILSATELAIIRGRGRGRGAHKHPRGLDSLTIRLVYGNVYEQNTVFNGGKVHLIGFCDRESRYTLYISSSSFSLSILTSTCDCCL